MNVIKGKIWKLGDNINTDLIVPSKYLTENNPKVIIDHAFDGVELGFSQKVNKGDIIIGGKNFGSGSSREEAVFVVKELGISAIIAESFARIYFRNLINKGIPAITLNDAKEMFKDATAVEIEFEKGIIRIFKNKDFLKEVNFVKIPDFINKILESGGTIEKLKKQFETR